MGRKSEYAPFIEEYLRSREMLLCMIRDVDADAACAATQDEREGLIFYSYELQCSLTEIEDLIEKTRQIAAENEPGFEVP